MMYWVAFVILAPIFAYALQWAFGGSVGMSIFLGALLSANIVYLVMDWNRYK